jgi:serine/threonine-protein kinase RCK2
MRDTNLGKNQERERERGRDRERAERDQKGYGQHSVAVTQAARQQVRDRNRAKGAFELSLDGATLLGRRAGKPAPPVGGA